MRRRRRLVPRPEEQTGREGKGSYAPRQVPVPNKWSVVGVAFDAVAGRKHDRRANRLAEGMLGVGDTATTWPSGTASSFSDCCNPDLSTFAERPIQPDDLEVQERSERHPKQVGREKPDGQR